MSVLSRLREHLVEQFDTATTVSGSGPEAAIAAGARIKGNRRIGYGIGLVAAIAAVTVTGFALRTESTPTEQTLSGGTVDGTAVAITADAAIGGVVTADVLEMASEGVIGMVDVDWEMADTTLSNLNAGWAGRVVAAEGVFYALSTVPGRAMQPAQAIYVSEDGLSWTMNPVGDGLWLTDIDGYQGSLYAIGTAPGFNMGDRNGPIEARVAVTSDAGATWQSTDLPVEAAPPADIGDVQWRSVNTRIAAGSQGVVAAVHTSYYVDYSRLMPAEFRGSGAYDAMRTETGLAVVDWQAIDALSMACDQAYSVAPEGEVPAECVALQDMPPEEAIVSRVTWEELGVDEPHDRYSEVFVSSDGVEFEPVSAPFSGVELLDLLATDDGFVGAEYADEMGQQLRFWYSPDGRQWEPMATPVGLGSFMDMGIVGDELVVLGYGQGWDSAGIVMFVTGDGGETWRSQDLQSVLGFGEDTQNGEFGVWIFGQSIGPDGIAVGVMVEPFFGQPNMAAHLFVSKDLSAWSELSLDTLGVGGETYFDSITMNGDIALATGAVSGQRFQQWFTVAGAIS